MSVDKINSQNQNQYQINTESKKLFAANTVNNPISVNTQTGLKADTIEFLLKNQSDKKSKNIFNRAITSLFKFAGIIPQKKQISPNIEFKDASTLKEALKFGQETLGIKKYEGFTEEDLDVVNWINEGLVNCSNAQKGSIAMPKKVIFRDVLNGSATIDPITLNLSIDKHHIAMTKELGAVMTGKNLTFKEAKILESNMFELNGRTLFYDSITYESPFSHISHEMGHLQHYANIGDSLTFFALIALRDESLRDMIEPIPILGRLNKNKEAKEIIKVFEDSKELSKNVSPYAEESPLEFVAECYAKLVDGIKLDNDTMKLYLKLGGVLI